MSSIINTSDGLAEASPDAVPKPYHNLSIVYIDHELEKPIKASAEAEAGENSRHPNLTVVYLDHHLNDSAPSGAKAMAPFDLFPRCTIHGVIRSGATTHRAAPCRPGDGDDDNMD
jgi:hypothetical protein